MAFYVDIFYVVFMTLLSSYSNYELITRFLHIIRLLISDLLDLNYRITTTFMILSFCCESSDIVDQQQFYPSILSDQL